MNNGARSRRVGRVGWRPGPCVSGGGGPAVGDDAVDRAGRGLCAGLEQWRAPRAVHEPGKIVADLAAALALGGDCLADIAGLREQPELAGPVASDPGPPCTGRRKQGIPHAWLTCPQVSRAHPNDRDK